MCAVCYSSAQSFEWQLPLDGDRLTAIGIEWMEPTPTIMGGDIVWDFSHAIETGERPIIRYRNFGDTLLVRYDGGIQHVYSLREDTLRQTGRESVTTRLRDTCAAIVFRLPLCVGDSLTSPFYYDGNYCGINALTWKGMMTVVVGTPGTLILPTDTIAGVAPVRVDRIGVMRLSRGPEDETIAATDTLTRCMSRRWLWYDGEHRYPLAVCEQVTHSAPDGTDLSQVQTSRIAPPDLQDYELPRQSHGRTKAPIVPGQHQSVGGEGGKLMNARLSDVSVSMNGESVQIDYSVIGEEALVEAVLCDIQGRVYSSMPRHRAQQGAHHHSLSVAGLPDGNYIVCVAAGEQRVTRHFTIP